MNKISRKLSFRISAVILVLFSISFLLNNYLLSKYYLHEKKISLSKIGEEIKMQEMNTILQNAKSIEEEQQVTIVTEDLNLDLISFNEALKNKLSKKGIALNKFWITEETLSKIKGGNKINQIYNQGKLKSSFLVTLIPKGDVVILVGVSIAHDSETIAIVNQLNFILISITFLCILIVVWQFSKRILQPLEKLKDISKEISNLNFLKVEIHTKDEIEELGNSINVMSEKLQKAHKELEEKNENLKSFISNISHELKTPLALIKAYSAGIEDGLDDGTYLKVIEKQAEDMSFLVDTLLALCKHQNDQLYKKVFDVEALFLSVFEKYKISIKNKNLSVSIDTGGGVKKTIFADPSKVEIVFNNFISNAIKYTGDNEVKIVLENVEDRVLFSIENEMGKYDPGQIEKIWEPFYVIENSRDKKISGTGLGLSIVKTILEKHELEYGFTLNENKIRFYMFFNSD